jgi:hypothetical protein
MKIFVKQLDNIKHELDIIPEWTVLHLKQHIHYILGIFPSHQRLIYKGYPMVDEDRLKNVTTGSTIHVLSTFGTHH